MAGITYLYGLWNMNMLGDSPVTMMDAHLDVQACLGTMEALSGEYYISRYSQRILICLQLCT